MSGTDSHKSAQNKQQTLVHTDNEKTHNKTKNKQETHNSSGKPKIKKAQTITAISRK